MTRGSRTRIRLPIRPVENGSSAAPNDGGRAHDRSATKNSPVAKATRARSPSCVEKQPMATTAAMSTIDSV